MMNTNNPCPTTLMKLEDAMNKSSGPLQSLTDIAASVAYMDTKLAIAGGTPKAAGGTQSKPNHPPTKKAAMRTTGLTGKSQEPAA